MARQRTERERPKKASFVKMRLLIAILATLCPVVCYISRQNLPLAIVSMVDEDALDQDGALDRGTLGADDDAQALVADAPSPTAPSAGGPAPAPARTNSSANTTPAAIFASSPARKLATAIDTCPEPTTTDESGKAVKKEKTKTFGPKYAWNQADKGLLLGAFFYTYVIFQIPGARLAERSGAKWILAAASFGSALLSFVSPWAASVHVNLLSLVRLLMGMFQSALYPTCYVLYSKWLPPVERSQALPILCVGAYVGSIIASGLTGYFSEQEQFGWEHAFYVPGVLCLIWSLAWVAFASNEPRDHKYISVEELQYIESRMELSASGRHSQSADDDIKTNAKPDISWYKLFTSQSIWAMMVAFFASNWSFTIVMLLIPTYLNNILHVSPMENGMINSAIYVLYCIVSPLVGAGSAMMVETRACGISRLGIRKLFQGTALLTQAACFLAIAWLGCDRTAVLGALFVQIFFFTFVNGGEVQLPSELSVDFSGTIYAIGNCVGSSTGFIVPYVFSQIVSEPYSQSQWDRYFYLAALICTLCALAFLTWGQNRLQDFSRDPAKQRGDVCKLPLTIAKCGSFDLNHSP